MDYEPDDDRDGFPCPRCYGDGTVDCHCGGDLCVCLNYGERDCPTCYGEGEVSEERLARYRESERAAHEAMQRVWAQAEAEATTASAVDTKAEGRSAPNPSDTPRIEGGDHER